MKKKILNRVVKFLSVTTIIGSSIISILDFLNYFEESSREHIILQTILILLAFFSVETLNLLHSEFDFIENSFNNQEKNIDILEASISSQIENAVKNLNGVYVENYHLDDSGFLFLTSKIKNSNHSIFHAAFSKPVPVLRENREEYEDVIHNLLINNLVTYRYIARLGEVDDTDKKMRRLDYIAKNIRDNSIQKYHPYYFLSNPKDGENPLPSFIIIDDKEVITLYPNCYSDQEDFLLIRHPDITKMYMGYFEHLAKIAEELNKQKLDQLEALFSI